MLILDKVCALVRLTRGKKKMNTKKKQKNKNNVQLKLTSFTLRTARDVSLPAKKSKREKNKTISVFK